MTLLVAALGLVLLGLAGGPAVLHRAWPAVHRQAAIAGCALGGLGLLLGDPAGALLLAAGGGGTMELGASAGGTAARGRGRALLRDLPTRSSCRRGRRRRRAARTLARRRRAHAPRRSDGVGRAAAEARKPAGPRCGGRSRSGTGAAPSRGDRGAVRRAPHAARARAAPAGRRRARPPTQRLAGAGPRRRRA